MEKIKELWENKGKIFTGIWNNFLKKEEIEKLYQERLSICKVCDTYTEEKEGCFSSTFQSVPCCDNRKGGCGCTLVLALKVPAKPCPKNYFPAIISEEDQKKLEEELYNQQFKKD